MFGCCRHMPNSAVDDKEDLRLVKTEDDDAPISTKKVAKASSSSGQPSDCPVKIKAEKEDRICPMTGAIGYCPMAKPKGGAIPKDKLPELKVLMLLVWEEGESKVSVGVYPHMTKHWKALELPDTANKQEIKAQFRALSIKFHPDKNSDPAAKDRFQEINEAHEALKNVDGELAFPWDKYPDRQSTMTGLEGLRTFGPLAKECSGTDPIKAQMMQHVVKEATECLALIYEQETTRGDKMVKETWADALCTDTRNGSNHLVKVYRRIVEKATNGEVAAATADMNTPE